MKFFVILLLSCLIPYNFVNCDEREPYHYTIRELKHFFSTSFMMEREHRPFGMVSKSKFHLTSVYDLYDHLGKFEAKGSARFFCLGVLYNWGTEIDVYDLQGKYIGMIDGQLGTMEQARFSFYDAAQGLVGIAYIDQSGSDVLITHPLYDTYAITMMNRELRLNVRDHWQVSVYDSSQIDSRLLKIFSAFIVDRQNGWLPDDDDD